MMNLAIMTEEQARRWDKITELRTDFRCSKCNTRTTRRLSDKRTLCSECIKEAKR